MVNQLKMVHLVCWLSTSFIVTLAADCQAVISWTGGGLDPSLVFAEDNYDLSGSTVTAIDPNVAVFDDVVFSGANISASDFGGGALQIGDSYSLSLNSTTFVTDATGGISGVAGGTTSAVHLSNGSSLSTQFATVGLTVNVDATSAITFRGGGDPINSQTSPTQVHLTPGATITMASDTEFSEHLAEIFVDGVSAADDFSILSFDGTGMTATAVAPAPRLFVEVDRQSGAMTIVNRFATPLTLTSYSISSPIGALNSDDGVWNSIADTGSPDDDWIEFTAPGDRNNIGESELPGGTGITLAQNQSINLGNAWIQNPSEDLTVQVITSTGPAAASVKWIGNPFVDGDFNFDGEFSAADWPAYLSGMFQDLSGLTPAEQFQRGDWNGDGFNNEEDFLIFENNYDALFGASAFATLVNASTVPEPATWLLVVLGSAFGWTWRYRQKLALAPVRCLALAFLLFTFVLSQDATAITILSSNFDAHGSTDGATEFTGINWTTNGVTSPGSTIALSAGATVQTSGAAQNADRLAVARNIDTAGPWNIDLTFDATQPGIQLSNLKFDYQFISGGGANQLGAHPNSGIVDVSILDAGLSPISTVQIGPLGTVDAASNVGTGIVADFPDVSLTNGATYTLRFAVSSDATSGNNFALDNLSLNAPAPLLSLEINTGSGVATLKNDTSTDIDLNFYKLTSATNSLDVNNWLPISGQGLTDFPAGDGSGNGWETAGGSNDGEVGEAWLSGDSAFAAGSSITLGSVYKQGSGIPDVMLRYRDTGSTAFIDVEPTYVTSEGIYGDYNNDGVVNLADYTVWRNNLGSSVALANENPDATTPGVVDEEDYAFWKSRFGATSNPGAIATVQAVPEPSTMAGVLCLAVVLFARRSRMLVLALGLLAILPAAVQAKQIDRFYQFGDDSSEVASPGVVIGDGIGTLVDGATLDSEGPGTDLDNFVDLYLAGGDPKYIDVNQLSRPLSNSGDLGVEFLGTGDYLDAFRLGSPSSSFSAATQSGDRNYAGIVDRGMQFWAMPYGAGNGSAQSLVADTPQHGVRINASGQWEMQYAGSSYDSGVGVDFDQWSHVMLVRPNGGANGARLYINGEIVAAAGGGYTVVDESPLVVGANSGESPGTAEYYQGVLDDLEMFILGRASGYPFDDYGTFTLGGDNTYVKDLFLPTATPGDLTGDGQVLGDGSGGVDDDVAAFISNWQAAFLVDDLRIAGQQLRAGDINSYGQGDFNMDGVVDLLDWYVILSEHEGAAQLNLGQLLATSQVPEPSSLILIAGAAVALSRRLRRRTSAQSHV
ncbi:PEP-CTERM sorting domain-containing protein [Aeoliella sp.]|uniref:PEP-CTERM sorting domain-containing protein n=1 Tax=Aeoliella sp. TaxID=2795800 RepID=UPI003CCBFF64